MLAVSDRVRTCERCFNLTEDDVCGICRDNRRDGALICAVEEASDIGAIERAGEFRGLYHVLGGRLSPLDGVGPEDLTVTQLVARVADGAVREMTTRGPCVPTQLPVGGDLEYADGVTIAQALSARREMR